MSHVTTSDAGDDLRFEFGENWSKFLATLDDERVEEATRSLGSLLERDSLTGTTFVDVGSGSGLSSLAARRLGAEVTSFDYDFRSVASTAELRRRHLAGELAPGRADGRSVVNDPTTWRVERGSALDAGYLRSIGTFDTVYSWGVLHHTGAMWEALDLVTLLTRPGGRLVVALYNDQGRPSRVWGRVKRAYNALPRRLRPLAAAAAVPYLLPGEEVKSEVLVPLGFRGSGIHPLGVE
jgi:SAM-dependent methyltransferase